MPSGCRDTVFSHSLFLGPFTTQSQSIYEQRAGFTHTTKSPSENQVKCYMATTNTSSDSKMKDCMDDDDEYQYIDYESLISEQIAQGIDDRCNPI